MAKKKAFITGITGQDGSYLAEFLLSKGYDVYGMIRRTSTIYYDRIHHIQDKINLVSGDIADQMSMTRLLDEIQPDEVYNLAAQSFVPASWAQPVFTGDITGLGTTRILEAIRTVNPGIRFYQASSSEMFGKVREVPQKESTPFYPRSPYGVAKVYGHWITINYRESYDIHASSGILFNHECVTKDTPVFIRRGETVDLLPIASVVPHGEGHKQTTEPTQPFDVWDANGWARVTCMTATWNGDNRKAVHRITAPGAIYEATGDHVVFTCADNRPVETPAGDVRVGDRLTLVGLPQPTDQIEMDLDEAWLLGALIAYGEHDATSDEWRFSCEDQALVTRLAQFADGDVAAQIYTDDGDKRVPVQVLNAVESARRAFLRGFNADLAFSVSSPVLAAGLYWLAQTTLHQTRHVTQDENGYHLTQSPTGQPLETVTAAERTAYDGWLFDLATESGTFHAGIGQGWVHNSPRRGIEFVTRKVSYNTAKIKLGLTNELRMGNYDAQRDWGFAGDYVQAMWLMLQQDAPDDYVVATGQTHSVKRLLEVAFSCVDLNWEDYTVQDEKFMRPAEVDLLVGDPSKAMAKLNWEPEVSFEELIQMMVESDIELLKKEM